jgi:hypothetical protein
MPPPPHPGTPWNHFIVSPLMRREHDLLDGTFSRHRSTIDDVAVDLAVTAKGGRSYLKPAAAV